ncbi:MAG: chemotaxis protein CheA [Francisellaceae bacterium]|nr:chemotaxis protein CheA [Francisellaceae bacterium]
MKLEADEEILQDFLLEVDDMLSKLTDLFLTIESEPSHIEAINELYRSFHTIKGGAGFLDLKPIVELCHKVESVFSLVRTKKIILKQSDIDIILSSYDTVVKMIEEVKSGQYPNVDYTSHIEELTGIIEASAKENAKTLEKLKQPNDSKSKVEPKKEENKKTDLEDENKKTEPEISTSKTLAPEKAEDSNSEDATKSMPAEFKVFSYNDFSYDKAIKVIPNVNMDDEIKDAEFLAMLDAVYGEGEGPTTKSYDKNKIISEVKKQKEATKATKAAKAAEKSASKDVKDPEKKEPLKKNDTKKSDYVGKSTDPKKVATAKPIEKKIVAKNDKKETTNIKDVKPGKELDTFVVESENNSQTTGTNKSIQNAVDNSIRIDATRLDDIMNMVGELVLVRNRLVNLKEESSDNLMLEAIMNLDVVTSSLQTSVMQTRMQSIKKLFGKFPRIIRDLAKNLNKDVTVEIEGENTELDKSLIDSLSEPMVHLIRNAVDHGLETKEERIAAKKNERGTIKLKAEQQGDHAYISISDDGHGINKKKVLEKARAAKIIAQDEEILDENKINMLIFSSGFSTADVVTDISGRGVGMDIVKNKIESLNGELQVTSKEGHGTTFKLKLPLTLAILPTLMVNVNSNVYAIPLSAVVEIINKNACSLEHVSGSLVLIYRGKTIPVCSLSNMFNKSNSKIDTNNIGHVLIVNDDNSQMAFVVDSLVGQEEVVIKPFNEILKYTPGFSGVTITGTGKVAIIIDVHGLIKSFLKEKISHA